MHRFCFIFIFILIARILYGQSLFNTLVPEIGGFRSSESGVSAFISASNENNNIFEYSSNNGTDRYLHLNRRSFISKIDILPISIELNYRDPQYKLYINNIKGINNSIEAAHYNNEFSANITAKYGIFYIKGGGGYSGKFEKNIEGGVNNSDMKFSLSYSGRYNSSNFNYHIVDETGIIALDFYFDIYSAKFTNRFISFSFFKTVLSPSVSREKMFADISGDIYGGKISLNWSIFSSDISYKKGNVATSFYEDESPFGKLKDICFEMYDYSLSCRFLKASSFTAGISGLKGTAGEGSYFDIWPFTYWDIFMAAKTELDSFYFKLNAPYVSTELASNLLLKNFLFKGGITGSYYKINLSDEIIYTEKRTKYILIAKEETKTKNIEFNYDGIFRLAGFLSCRYRSVELNITASQLIPVDFHSLKNYIKNKKQNDNSEDNSNGGFQSSTNGGRYISISATGFF